MGIVMSPIYGDITMLYQAALGGHTGNIALAFKAESHTQVQYQVQYRMQSCIQLCAGVKKIL